LEKKIKLKKSPLSNDKTSFYGLKITEKNAHRSVFILENNSYFLHFIYDIDEEKFESEYEKEGVFFRNLQMPRIFSYIKKDENKKNENQKNPEEIDKKTTEKNKTIKDFEQIDKKLIGKIKDTKPKKKAKKKKYSFMNFSSSTTLSDGRIVETWKAKDGRTARVYRDADGSFSQNHGR